MFRLVGCQLQHSLRCLLLYLPLRNGSLHLCSIALCLHTTPFLPSSSTLLPRSVFPSPIWVLASFFCLCMQHPCPSFLFYTLSFSAPLSLPVFPPAVCLHPLFSHMLFISVSPCLMPVGSWLGMLPVLLCVSRTYSLSLLQLCGMMAPLTSGSAAVMVI